MKSYLILLPPVIFIVLAFAIVYPLFSSGYILSLDAVAGPWKNDWIQKIMLVVIFFLAGTGMYYLVKAKNLFVGIFAGVFYAVNPFIYERVMAGHWEFLMGYALFPFAAFAAKSFLENPGWKAAIILAGLTGLMFNLALHWTIILGIFITIYTVFALILNTDRRLKVIKFGVVFAIAVLVFNANWLIPIFLGQSMAAGMVSLFSRDDLIAFQSYPDPNFGLVFNLLSGYGFWAEAQNYFISPKEINFLWPVSSLFFMGLTGAGIYNVFKNRVQAELPLAITLTVMFFISIDLAGGVALDSFSETAFWLYDKFVPLRGLREPQKIVGIIMFCYAYFGAIGLAFLLEKIKPIWKHVVVGIFLLMPFIYTPTIFGGFWGQLKPVLYPQSWAKVNTIISGDNDKFLTLFFPWHMYMRFGFNNDRVVVNPAPYYFSKPILSSENYETKSLYSHDGRPEALHIEGLLSIENTGYNLVGERVADRTDWGESTAVIGVKYIILAKDSDWKNYKFLEKSSFLEKVYETNEIILYKNLAWSSEN